MAGGGSNGGRDNGRPGTGGPNPGQAPNPFTWGPGGKPATGTFDPKTVGTRMYQDLNTAYGQGPKINPVNPFTDYGQQTKDLISGGLSRMSPIANGQWLSGGNPYLEAEYAKTRDNIMQDVGSSFTSSGRFGGGSYVNNAVDRIASNENSARADNFNTEYNRMLGAQGQGLALSGLLDSKNAEKTAADSTMWDRTNNAPFQHLAQYFGLSRGGDSANETNKPLTLIDFLSGIGTVAGSFF